MNYAVWQVGVAHGSRACADVFLKYGVALIGPGDAGEWKPGRHDDEFGGSSVRWFASEVQLQDVFLLRTGISTICAVGRVASEYLYLHQFDDVCGCDLQHARRVRWFKLPEEYTFKSAVFGASPTRCSRVRNPEVLDYVRRFLSSPPTRWQTAGLRALPPEEPPLEDVPPALQGLVATAKQLIPLTGDLDRFGEPPSEDELISHFVVPFLRALGWPLELIAVEWRHIDVAVFRALPRTPDNCHLVIEAKRLGAGVEGALEQAKRYVQELGTCRDVVVTDGIRYRMYSCEKDFKPIAYANLVRLKKSASELFARMTKG